MWRKIALTVIPILFIVALVVSVDRCVVRRNRSELERRASILESQLAEESKLHGQAVTTLEQTEVELANIRAAYSRIEAIRDELIAEVDRLGITVGNLENLHTELASGTGEALQYTSAIDGETRRSLDIVERLQEDLDETD